MNWIDLADEELLKWRIRDLEIPLNESDVWPLAREVLGELEGAKLGIQPRIYLGDEWFSPEGENAVSIPFFLAHPRLRALEKKQMQECEGESADEFKRLLRHEIGHAFDHAFKVSKRKTWREFFGSPKVDYHPETYHPRPYSKNFVQNIPRWYAQAHPDEDFAETFAVWLNPNSNWRQVYKGWGAFKKLQYVEKLAKEFAGRTPAVPSGRMISDARFLNSTLRTYYEKKRREYSEDYPDVYDRDLLRIFSKPPALAKSESALQFIRKNERAIVSSIAHWTGEKKFTIEALLGRIKKRSKDLELSVSKPEAETALELSSFLATLISNYLFTGHFKRSV